MSILKRTSNFLSQLGASMASIAKVVLLSRCTATKGERNEHPENPGEIVILGNGPALRNAIDHNRNWMMSRSRMAVNFAANAPEFNELHPQYYILADPHFFNLPSADPNVTKLWENLGSVTWQMTLFVPCGTRLPITPGSNITVKTFNMTPVEGFKWLRHTLYRAGMGMPRPRNVMIPAIMNALREGFKTIYLAGADHTWTRTLAVDDHNHVISVQPHFYKDSDKEQRRVNTEYEGLHLHDILRSLTIAFSSYFLIADYAKSQQATILNATPGSFIDAFPRVVPPDDPE